MGIFNHNNETFLISAVSEAIGTIGNGWAREVWGDIYKSSNVSGERKNVCKNLWNHQNDKKWSRFLLKVPDDATAADVSGDVVCLLSSQQQ